MMFLIFLALEKVFAVSQHQKLFTSFFWIYNLGLILTASMMVWHGILTVNGEESSAMISGIAGLGHIFITIALTIFVTALGRSIKTVEA